MEGGQGGNQQQTVEVQADQRLLLELQESIAQQQQDMQNMMQVMNQIYL
jgi:hypothetical protein